MFRFISNVLLPVNVVDNNPEVVQIVNHNPEQVQIVDHNPEQVQIADNNPEQVHVIDNNPSHVHVIDNNPSIDVIDPGFYRPGNGDVIDPGFYRPGRPIDGSELIDKEPLIIDPPYRPRFPADQPYLRGGK
ncbi:uncharacterized protein LOC116772139 isoform X14 [Danaus plexippus]|uniref:uncharacterized protein LOC116772139 isoform X13 n=1 Tax=Danaus plexippus TaxID=13037 RepID=UPI002AAFEED3|nr:uncharacterized protein LOC116772139 isoform X13 [Danaus plexippus]XP_061384067.1 uncharacterized protein LOC116772139 isoform X14 [Danaus plexippus]